MIKKRAHFKPLISAAAAILLLAACDLYTRDPIEITGTWVDPVYSSSITVTEDAVDFGFYTAAVVNWSNYSWNSGESTLASGDFGYAVIQYTSAPSWNPGMEGKYMVLRWKDYDPSGGIMSYSEGYKDGNYFDTPSAAVAGATAAAGYFPVFTENAEKQ